MSLLSNVRIAPWQYWVCAAILILASTGQLKAEPESSPVSEPASTTDSSPVLGPTPESLPSAADGAANNALSQEDAAATPAAPASLFREAATEEQNQAEETEKRRERSLLQAQNMQAAADVFSRITYERTQTNAEALYSGVGGVPQALNPLYAVPATAESTGFRLGAATVRPILSAGLHYGSTSDNLDRGSNGFYGSLSPAFAVTLGEPATGRLLNMEYTGSLTFGAEDGERVRYDQSLAGGGTLSFTKLTLGFGVNLSQLTGSDRDFGGQDVDRVLLGLSLNASYTYSEKTNFSTSLSVPIRLFSQGDSSGGVSGAGFINYVYSPLTTIGVGVKIGMVEVERNDTQVYEQLLMRLTYVATGKLTFSGTGGVEFRDTGATEEVSPVFGLGLAWAIREGTTLSLNGERRILNSAAQSGANYTDTSVSVSAAQRLGQYLQLTATMGYENAEYMSAAKGVSTNRSDHQVISQGALSYHFRDRWILTGIISYSKNFSNQRPYDAFQNSLQISYVF
jgi:hypothetical protein